MNLRLPPLATLYVATLFCLAASTSVDAKMREKAQTKTLPFNMTTNVTAKLVPLREAFYTGSVEYPEDFILKCLRDEDLERVVVPLRGSHVSMKANADPTSVPMVLREHYAKQPTFVHIGDGDCVYLGEFSANINFATSPIGCDSLSENYDIRQVDCDAVFDVHAWNRILVLQSLHRTPPAGQDLHVYKVIRLRGIDDDLGDTAFRHLDLVCTNRTCNPRWMSDALYSSEEHEPSPRYPDKEDF